MKYLDKVFRAPKCSCGYNQYKALWWGFTFCVYCGEAFPRKAAHG